MYVVGRLVVAMMRFRFVFFFPRKSHPELQGPLGELRKHLLESSDDMAPLKVWELQGSKHRAYVTYYFCTYVQPYVVFKASGYLYLICLVSTRELIII